MISPTRLLSWLKARGIAGGRQRTRGRTKIIRGEYNILYAVDPSSALDDHVMRRGRYGDWLAAAPLPLTPADGIIFDIGANVGLLTLVFAKKYVPRGMVYAYEPDPQNYHQLSRNVQLNQYRNVQIFPTALQEDRATAAVTLYLRRSVDADGKENRGLSSLLPLPAHRVGRRTTPASTVDREAERLHLPRLDLIKIDVEGAEHRVLEGGVGTIKKFRPIIQYEYSNVLDQQAKSQNTVKCFRLLECCRYRQYGILGEETLQELVRPSEALGDVNVICFPAERLPRLIVGAGKISAG